MRTISGIILAVTLFLSSYAGTASLPSQSWASFRPLNLYDFSCAVYHDPSSNPSCASITDSTDFYWTYYDGCTCMTPCCPSIAVASKRPFYASRKAMNYSDYKGDIAKLADTALFAKCTTSVSYPFYGCSFPSTPIVGYASLVPGGVDSLSTRLFVFRTRSDNYVPLRIDRIVLGLIVWPASGQSFTKYDSMSVTFGNFLLTETAGPVRRDPGFRSALRISKTREGYMISGLGENRGRLEIVNGHGKSVYSQSVFSSSCTIGKNALGQGIYFVQLHSQAGISSVMLPRY